MPSVRVRICLAVAALVLTQAGVILVRAGHMYGEIIPLNIDLSQLPRELGTWYGEDYDLTHDVLRVLYSEDAGMLNRRYANLAGEVVSVHVATWTDYGEEYITPHYPDTCLKGAGMQIVGEKRLSLADKGSPPQPVRLLSVQDADMPSATLYWYQRVQLMFVDRAGGKEVNRHYWGQPKPAVLKVLLTTTAETGEAAEERLLSVAKLVHNWLAEAKQTRKT
jgi:hypothetical protein